MKDTEKLFVVRKYISAKDVSEAIRKEKSTPVADIYVDDEWKKENQDEFACGFRLKKAAG